MLFSVLILKNTKTGVTKFFNIFLLKFGLYFHIILLNLNKFTIFALLIKSKQ
nr:MAG TPA: hypothetical protein [Caudoviricetes sp.]